MVLVERRGRKRLAGDRKPSGDLKKPYVDPRFVVRDQPHRRHLPVNDRLDPRAETPFGALAVLGHITRLEYQAGKIYAGIVGRYRNMIEAPKATPSSVGVMIGNGSVGAVAGFACWCGGNCPGENVADALERACEASRRKKYFDRAHAALEACGHRAARAVSRMAVWGEACPEGLFDDLICGLRGLLIHFALYERDKRSSNVGYSGSETSSCSR